ncbi:MAG: family 16 glycosylhydrolase [Thermoguttaceae bacterium]|nr:family 16 glycosylhydrolase [Thermoguttaceae bacterium]
MRSLSLVAVLVLGVSALGASEERKSEEKRPTKIWNRTGPLGQTPKHVTDAYPLSDQENRGNWVKFEPMSDEFEGKELDRAKWHVGMEWWKGRQPALFSDKNVTVSDGKLHLTMRKEKLPPEAEKLGYKDYTSAALHTKARSSYGYYEVKAKPMNSAGSSAFWFQMDETPGWATEIDVFEIGGNAKGFERKYHMTLHVTQTPREKKHWSVHGVWEAPWRLADDYHVYGFDWGKDELKFYVDGVLVRTVENTHWHQPLYLIFDSETMPKWFGMPDDKDLPSTFSIEYVRAWKAGGASPKATQKAYVPEPQPVRTDILVGAHNCPLWEADQPQMWNQVLKHPERTPALGFYSQENPEVADWETKWAVEHGISFFVYCWYRNGQGGPVKMRFASAIHDALWKSRYVSKMKFTIMWENQARGTAGVANEADLFENLLPFWIQNYFRHPSYLKIDNKPLLFIYRPEFLVQDLGSVEKVRQAMDKMRRACRDAGFDGLYLLGEYRGLDPKHLTLMKQLGLDYTFAYCWHVQGNPNPKQAIAAQLDYIEKTRRLGILPQVVTVSQGWSGWHDEGSIWKIPPAEYKELLEKAKAILRTFPANELGHRMILLDNWNEWSEGHYIAPHREFGFGYLDAVREVFSDAPKDHVDLLPKDVGLGPYDEAFHRRQGPKN